MSESYVIILQVFASLSLSLVISFFCLFYWKHWRILAEARKLPTGIRVMPIVGHAYLIVNGFVGMTNIMFNVIKKAVAENITTGVIWLGPYPLFVLCDPGDIQMVLNSTKALEGGVEHELLSYAIGNSLPVAPVNIWKIKRRHMNPMFHPRNLNHLMPVLNECGRDLVQSLFPHVSRGEVNVLNHNFPVFLKAVFSLTFGPELKVNCQTKEFQGIKKAISSISRLTAERLFKIWLWPEVSFRFFYRKEINEINYSGKLFVDEPMKVTENKRKIRGTQVISEKNINIKNEESHVRQITLSDVYSGLQNAYPGFTDEDKYHEIIMLLASGSESSKLTMSSCLLALAANQEIQERQYKEIMSVTGSHDSDVSLEDLKAMPYLDQVINETLRKFIIIPLITRRIRENMKLSNCTVPAGATVGIAFLGLHFNPTYFPDPERFDPGRFAPENIAQRAPYTFVPFSGGPRNCIGKGYSMVVMKTLLVHVIRKYKLSTSVDINNMTYIAGAVARCVNGYNISLELR